MGKNVKSISKEILIVLLSLAIIIGFGMPGIGYMLASQDSTAVTSHADSTTTETLTQPTIPTNLAGKTVTITGYKTGSNYVATKATSNDTINSPSASSNITEVTLADKSDSSNTGTIKIKTGVLTLVVNNQQIDIIKAINNKTALAAGTYEFAATAGTDTYSEGAKFGNMGGNTAQYTYRSALKVQDGAIASTETIASLLKNSTYDASSISNGSLTSNGGFFNGIIVDSKTKNTAYSINNMKLNFVGDGANDFQGEGAAILAETSGNATAAPGGAPTSSKTAKKSDTTTSDLVSTVNLNNSYVHTQGVIRTAAAAKGKGILKINNSVIYAEETNDTNDEYDALVVPMMKRTPFALGIEGTVRATNILGSGQGIYTNSLIASSGWGVLSTDSGTSYEKNNNQYALNVTGVTAGIGSVEKVKSGKIYTATKKLNGTTYGFTMKGSGYVAYADSGVHDKFTNVKFYSPDYIQIMASSTSSAYYNKSLLKSGRIGIMTQQNNGGTISLKNSTLSAKDTGVQIKSGKANKGYTNVIFDNTKVKLGKSHKWGGTLVELVESDDAGNPGVTSYKTSDTGDKATAGAASISASNTTFKNGTYTGNIWNNIYNNTEKLNVKMSKATVNGTISSSYGYHLTAAGKRMANGTTLNAYTHGDYRTGGLTDYKKIGAFYNVAHKQINNPINVKMTNHSKWNVKLANGNNGKAKACYIHNLYVGKGSKITSSKKVTIYVYGTKTIKGTVSKNITIKKVKAGTGSTDDGITSTTQFYDGIGVTFKVVDANGNNVKSAATVTNKSFTDVQFTVAPAAGYTVKDVTASSNGTVTKGKTTDGYDYDLTHGSAKDTVVVTITVTK